MTIPALPNLAPTGVVQNPGIGEILGGGLSHLAQFLQQKQQLEQQRLFQQAQIGQEQQRIDQTRAYQTWQMQQAEQERQRQLAVLGEQKRKEGEVGRGLQQLSAPAPSFEMPMLPAQQLGGGPSDVPSYSMQTGGGETDVGTVAQGMQPLDFNALTAAPGFKAIMEQRAKGEEAKRLGRKIINVNGTPVFEQGDLSGQAAGPAIPGVIDNPKEIQIGLTALGKRLNTDLSDPKQISPAQREQVMKIAGIWHREGVPNTAEAPDVAFGKIIVPEYMKMAQSLTDDSMSAKTELMNIRNAQQALASGMYAGPGAKIQTRLGLIASKITGDPELGNRADATNAYLQATASRIVPLPKGINRLTNTELLWLERMKGADPSQWGEAGINAMLAAAAHAAEDRLTFNNKKLEKSLPGSLKPEFKQNLRDMYQVDLHGPDTYKDIFGQTPPGGP